MRAQSFLELMRFVGTTMATDADAKKRRTALAALELARREVTIGVGTGSTVNLFIDALAAQPGSVRRAISSSEATSARLRAAGLEMVDLNEQSGIALYVDGADEATPSRQQIGRASCRERWQTVAGQAAYGNTAQVA